MDQVEYGGIPVVHWYQWYDWYQWSDLELHWYTIGEIHLIDTRKPWGNKWSIGTLGKVVSRLVNHWNLDLKTNVMT